eukprot:3878902-Pleurochrysis_carterae.AAC.1
MAAGYKLQFLGYQSKTFDATQDDGPYLMRRPAQLSWRARIGIDSLRVDQPLCFLTTLWQPALYATLNVRARRDSKGGG